MTTPSPLNHNASIRIGVCAAFFLSGLTGLIYEVVWMRLLSHTFGVTVHAMGIVLAAFMAGLALGSFLIGRAVERFPNPIRVYGWIELGIGLFALTVPTLIHLLDTVYALIYQGTGLSLWVLSPLRFLFAFILLVIPTFLMGGTLPALSRAFISEAGEVGKWTGRLYGLNTIGGALGPIAAGFVLIPTLGVWRSNLLAGLLNILIGILAILLLKMDHPEKRNLAGGKHRTKRVKKVPPSPSVSVPLVTLAIALSGFAALTYEIVWTKVFSLIIENTVYAFSTMLATFLTGLALGGLLYRRIMSRRSDLTLAFGLIEGGIGLYGLLTIPLFRSLAERFYQVQGSKNPFAGSWFLFTGSQALGFAAIMLIPTLLMGMALPLVCQMVCQKTQDMKGVGSKIGAVYSANTVGAVAGSLLASFILIPLFGLQKTLAAAAGINLLIAMLLFFRHPVMGYQQRWALLALLGLFFFPAGRIALSSDITFQSIPEGGRRKILYHHEDAGGIVEVIEDKETRVRTLLSNRLRQEGANSPNDIYIARQQGDLPLLLHADPKEVLVIGLGTGISLASTLHEKVSDVTVVELSRGVIEAARFFAHENREILTRPKVHLIEQDGRNYIHLTDRRYDVIVQELFFPYRAGVGNLYTVEHYRQIRARLKPGGLLCQWIAVNQVSSEDLKRIIKTFQTVSPNTSLWLVGGYIALIGTDGSLSIDMSRLSDLFRSVEGDEDPSRRRFDPKLSLATFLFEGNDVADFVSEARVNTDDNALIEFHSPRAFRQFYTNDLAIENLALLQARHKPIVPYLTRLGPKGERTKAALTSAYRARHLVLNGMISRYQRNEKDAFEKYQAAWRLNGDDPFAIEYLRGHFFAEANRRLKEGEGSRAEEALLQTLRIDPSFEKGNFTLGNYYYNKKEFAKAVDAFEKVLALSPTFPGASYNLGNSLYSLGEYRRAVSALQRALELEPGFVEAHYNLGNSLFQIGEYQQAVAHYRKVLAAQPTHRNARHNMKVALEQTP
ncbi:MAG: fused MFS/spermidine synthase [Nitrospiria bacterium]